MSDRRKNNGGARKGSGRKPKADEKKIQMLLSPHVPGAIDKVVHIMKNAESEKDQLAAAKLILEYAFGKPKQSVDHTTDGDKINSAPFQIEVISPPKED